MTWQVLVHDFQPAATAVNRCAWRYVYSIYENEVFRCLMDSEYRSFIEKYHLDALDTTGFGSETSKIYNYFHQEFKSLLNLSVEVHQMKPVVFYIKSSLSCNAFAQRIAGQNIMGITQGYPILMSAKFNDLFFEKIIFAAFYNDKDVSDGFAELYGSNDFKFSQYMLDCSIRFTFYHEFRHLRQFDVRHSHEDLFLSENYLARDFDLDKHILEYDADKSAGHQVVLFAVSIHRKLGLKSKGILKCLLYCALGSLIVTKAIFYFGIMGQIDPPFNLSITEFYTKENWHPHSAVRALNLLDTFTVSMEDGFPKLGVKTQDLVTNGLGIAKLYFDVLLPNSDTSGLIFDNMFNFIDEANAYNDFLHSEALKNPVIQKLIKSR